MYHDDINFSVAWSGFTTSGMAGGGRGDFLKVIFSDQVESITMTIKKTPNCKDCHFIPRYSTLQYSIGIAVPPPPSSSTVSDISWPRKGYILVEIQDRVQLSGWLLLNRGISRMLMYHIITSMYRCIFGRTFVKWLATQEHVLLKWEISDKKKVL